MSFISERRYTPRFKLSVPLLFFPATTLLEWGNFATSINISKRGVYFKTEYPMFVGLPVRVMLTMPKRFCHSKSYLRCLFTGRITHIGEKDAIGRGVGVGVEFFYSEPVTEEISNNMRCLVNLPRARRRSGLPGNWQRCGRLL